VESTGLPGGEVGLERVVASVAASSKAFAAASVSVNVAEGFTTYKLRHSNSLPLNPAIGKFIPVDLNPATR
jgi:hypothetical protein